MPEQELQTKHLDVGIFSGREVPLFPELGNINLRLFQGVEKDLLASVMGHQEVPAQEIARHVTEYYGAGDVRARLKDNPFTSVGTDGTCLAIEGL